MRSGPYLIVVSPKPGLLRYDWIENGENVPPGWKYRVVVCTNGLERHFFLAPDGSRYFQLSYIL